MVYYVFYKLYACHAALYACHAAIYISFACTLLVRMPLDGTDNGYGVGYLMNTILRLCGGNINERGCMPSPGMKSDRMSSADATVPTTSKAHLWFECRMASR